MKVGEMEWDEFSAFVRDHIAKTMQGHYERAGGVQPLAFKESHFGLDYLCGQVVKYMCRVPKTRSSEDCAKAAHYLSRVWAVLGSEAGQARPKPLVNCKNGPR